MKNLKNAKYILLTLVFFSCSLNTEREIKYPYYLISVETDWDTNIAIKLSDGNYEGRIPNKVIEYALEKNYIFAKQQEYDYRTQVLDTCVNYYILEVGGKYSRKINLKEFEKFLEQENISKVKWKKV